jgi:glycosyltransferase involved in cell wall biosynthesis
MTTLFDDGRGGVLTPQGDAKALGLAITDLVLDKSRRAGMGALNRTSAIERHSWDSTARKILAFYKETLGR